MGSVTTHMNQKFRRLRIGRTSFEFHQWRIISSTISASLAPNSFLGLPCRCASTVPLPSLPSSQIPPQPGLHTEPNSTRIQIEQTAHILKNHHQNFVIHQNLEPNHLFYPNARMTLGINPSFQTQPPSSETLHSGFLTAPSHQKSPHPQQTHHRRPAPAAWDLSSRIFFPTRFTDGLAPNAASGALQMRREAR